VLRRLIYALALSAMVVTGGRGGQVESQESFHETCMSKRYQCDIIWLDIVICPEWSRIIDCYCTDGTLKLMKVIATW